MICKVCARVPPLPPSIEDLSPFPQFPPLCSRADAILDFRWRESPSSSSGSAESNASDRALLDLDMVGNVKNVTVLSLRESGFTNGHAQSKIEIRNESCYDVLKIWLLKQNHIDLI